MRELALVCSYIGANVLANLVVARLGQAALVATAFLLIPFDMAARDVLHERWQGRALWRRMAALVATGGAISYAVNADARGVAIASAVAFVLAGATDTLIYAVLHERKPIIKMNASNAASAVVDSLVFPLTAFGALDVALSSSQAALKFVGGAVWSLLLTRVWKDR